MMDPKVKEIGRCRCPGCGKQMTVREDKNGRGYGACPWCDEETLDPCATRIFFGRPATASIKAKSGRAENNRNLSKRDAQDRAVIEDKKESDDDGLIF
jgi:hypothetical protein